MYAFVFWFKSQKTVQACNIRVHRKVCVCVCETWSTVGTVLGQLFLASLEKHQHTGEKKQRGDFFLNTFLFNVFTSFNLLRRSEVLQACLFNDHGQQISSAVLLSSFSLNIWAWSCGPPRVLHADLGFSGGLCTPLERSSSPGRGRTLNLEQHWTLFCASTSE